MPSAPKPSQKKVAAVKTTKVKKAAKPRAVAKATTPRIAGEMKLPERGKMGAVVKALKDANGLSKDALNDVCASHKLSPYGTKHAHYLANRIGLLRA